MKEIVLHEPDAPALTRADVYTAEVDWFPPLTEQQILENAIALANSENTPHPNPNFISVTIIRSGKRMAALVELSLRPES